MHILAQLTPFQTVVAVVAAAGVAAWSLLAVDARYETRRDRRLTGLNSSDYERHVAQALDLVNTDGSINVDELTARRYRKAAR